MWYLYLIIILMVLIILFSTYAIFFPVTFQTLKRDFRGSVRFLRTKYHLWHASTLNITVDKLFDVTAKKYSSKICIYFEDQKWTFEKLQEQTNKLANYFLKQGYIKGDNVAIFMENCPEYVAIWLGLAKIGVAPALLNYNLRQAALAHCLQTVDCKAVIFSIELYPHIKELIDDGKIKDQNLYCVKKSESSPKNAADIPEGSHDLLAEISECSIHRPKIAHEINFHDNLFYIYTSGTTGLPKAAVIKHSRYMMASSGNHYVSNIRTDDVVYTPLPLYHSAAGILGVGHAINFGTSIVIRKKFSASGFWTDCIKYEVTVAQYIGEICRYLLSQSSKPEDTQHKVRLVYGNGLRAEIWDEFLTRFNIPNVSEFYGSTEGNCNLVNIDNTVGAVGFLPRLLRRLVPMHLIKLNKSGEPIRDEKTGLAVICKNNEPGELVGVIRAGDPITAFQGYTDKNSGSKKMVFNVLKKGDSAFRSGDVLMIDEYGYVFFKDRLGDTFRWKGENVSTAEVESIMSRVLGLKDVAVYGVSVPGADGKAGMAAIVDTDNSVDLKSLESEIEKNLPSYARPIFLRILNQIDMTGTYKMKKVDLQEEGFDLERIKDKLYFYSKNKYDLLTDEIYTGILNEEIRL